MNYKTFLIGAGVACVAGAAAEEPQRHRFSLGPSYLLNARVRMEISPFATPDPSSDPLQDRNYNDGYNRVDDSDNFDGRTSYYGYQNNSQVDLNADTLSLHNVSLTSGFRSNNDNAQAPGIEGRYGYRLGGGKEWEWGVEGGLGWFSMDQSVRGNGPASMRLLTDAYDLGGVVPPPGPYSGPFETGPGLTRIDDDPARTITTETGTVNARVSVDGNLWLVRLGPWIEWQATERFNLGLHAGFALVTADLSATTDSTYTVPGVATVRRSASASEFDWLPGGYVGLEARYDLGKRWSLAVGADWLNAGSIEIATAGTRSEVDLTRAVVVRGLLSYSF